MDMSDSQTAAPPAADAPALPAAPDAGQATTLLSGTPDAGQQQSANPAPAASPSAENKDANAKPSDPAAKEAKPAEDAKDGKPDPITAESYGDFTIPEGMPLDADMMGQFKTIAADLKLTKDQAQRLVDLQTARTAKEDQARADAVAQWAKDAEADKEIGGAHFQDNLALARKGADAFASPVLRDLLDQSGLGNHAAVLKHFVALGKLAREDPGLSRPAGGAPAGEVSTVDYYKQLFSKK